MGQKCCAGFLLLVVVGALGWLAGCGQDTPAPGPSLEPHSQSGERQYLDACQAYQAIEFSGLCGQNRALALAERVQKPLLAARTNDPRSPLYATKYADVLLEISSSNADEADSAYVAVIKS